MTTLFGWTFKQWASAAAIMKMSPSTMEEVLDLKVKWHERWVIEPTEKSLIHGVEKPMDYEAARDIFRLVTP